MQDSREVIEKIKNLPTLSPILYKIRSVMSLPDVSANDIVEVLKLDPAISGKVLRLANSAYIGIPRTVSSLQNAVVILGQQRIYSLVLAASALSAVPRGLDSPFTIRHFWKHSVTVAIICESIARHLQRYDDMESGEFFCAGILHDIGKLALGAYDPARIAAAHAQSLKDGVAMFTVEDQELSHYRIGFHLAERWNLPENLANAILSHHVPQAASGYRKMASIVHLSDIMAHLIGLPTFPDEAAPTIEEFAVEQIGLSAERLRTIAYEACEDEKRIEAVIDLIE